jgi:hypothetical protein
MVFMSGSSGTVSVGIGMPRSCIGAAGGVKVVSKNAYALNGQIFSGFDTGMDQRLPNMKPVLYMARHGNG